MIKLDLVGPPFFGQADREGVWVEPRLPGQIREEIVGAFRIPPTGLMSKKKVPHPEKGVVALFPGALPGQRSLVPIGKHAQNKGNVTAILAELNNKGASRGWGKYGGIGGITGPVLVRPATMPKEKADVSTGTD